MFIYLCIYKWLKWRLSYHLKIKIKWDFNARYNGKKNYDKYEVNKSPVSRTMVKFHVSGEVKNHHIPRIFRKSTLRHYILIIIDITKS